LIAAAPATIEEPAVAAETVTKLGVVGLFAGIGGIESGLQASGLVETRVLCEIDEGARRVLSARFPDVDLHGDVRDISARDLPEFDILTAGFPCQDLSQAGSKAGIAGTKSSLVDHVFRVLLEVERRGSAPTWVVIENVSYMLRLGGGAAMSYVTSRFEALGYTWAYRVVDARSFGVPQRRQRVILVASKVADPRAIVFGASLDPPTADDVIGIVDASALYGFYWTEGKRGLGWTKNAVPTIKGGSRVGIPSPPAIWIPIVGSFVTPSLEDAERLQGFPAGWTEPADEFYSRPRRGRWTLVGNAVCVPVAAWVGARLRHPADGDTFATRYRPLTSLDRWPNAAWGRRGERYAADMSTHPLNARAPSLSTFLAHPWEPLSYRAARGFLHRAESSSLRFAEGFLDDLRKYVAMRDPSSAP
jgi:DNA (cytosine-5)-methyltransferase 1